MKKNEIDASPSKDFFIGMLTRDIPVTDCILDLVDNSIDSVLRKFDINIIELLNNGHINDKFTLFKKIEINIELKRDRFSIKDNCFGIEIDTAKNYAFRFGSGNGAVASKSGLSVYGIGMKRAFFKIGKDIHVTSFTPNNSFTMDINVNEWAKDPNKWVFEFSEINEDQKNSKTGTEIIIKDLNEAISKRFGDEVYIANIKDKIEKTYTLFINAGLSITINLKKLSSNMPSFNVSKDIPVARQTIEIGSNEDIVNVSIIAGIGDVKTKGWYVFCNGRLILEGNIGYKTGWGVDFPQFHSKFNQFSGIIYFSSRNVKLLPWTTTKEDVEIDSEIYQNAINHAKILIRPILTFLNNAYPDKKDIEDEEEIVERKAIKSTKPQTIAKISYQDTNFKFEPKIKKVNSKTTISYTRKKTEVDTIKEHIGNMRISNREIGELTFNYYLEVEDLK